MADPQLPLEKTSAISIWRAHPIAATLATIGLLALGAGTVALLYNALTSDEPEFFDTDEAPIRVRNGSIDLFLESGKQVWAQDGSGNWRSSGGELAKDDYDVAFTINGGSCPNGEDATGDNVVITYSDGKSIRVQALNKHTLVKPENGATLEVHQKDQQRLTYKVAGGHIASVAVGPGANPPPTCTFQNAAELDNVRLRGKP